MTLRILNDLHLGVARVGGTTPASAEALRAYAQRNYAELLKGARRVAINGDMFDTYQVPASDVLEAYLTTVTWLNLVGESLWLIPGNHDLAKNSANMGSFELLARFLEDRFPGRVTYCLGSHWIDRDEGIYAVSHVANQELFDKALEGIPDSAKYVLLHCNYDNFFAGQSDHSLNLSRSQAKELVGRGMTLILGHEHQGRSLMDDKVVIVGNQFPTSIADCKSTPDAQTDQCKYMLEISGDSMELKKTWAPSANPGGYREVEWQTLNTTESSFIRVVGDASVAQASEVIRRISEVRQKSTAFVISNAVKSEGTVAVEALAESVEDIRSVNIIDMLMEHLSEEQRVVIRPLLTPASST